MNQTQIISIAVPVQERSFEQLRAEVGAIAQAPIPKTTLRDWIINVCLLREANAYSESYNVDDLACLGQWLVYRRQFGRNIAVKKFHEYLRSQLDDSTQDKFERHPEAQAARAA